MLPERKVPGDERLLHPADDLLGFHGRVHLTEELKEPSDHLQLARGLRLASLAQPCRDRVPPHIREKP